MTDLPNRRDFLKQAVLVTTALPEGVRGKRVRLLVSGQKSSAAVTKGWSRFQLKSLLDHEVVVLS